MEHSQAERVKNAINKVETWLWPLAALHVIVEITDINCGLLSKHLLQRTQQHGSFTKPLGNDKFM